MIGGRRTEKPESIITGHRTGGEAMEGNTRAETKKATLRGGEGILLIWNAVAAIHLNHV